jgi:hypothetical protein
MANHFADAGWDVTVLTVSLESLGLIYDKTDESLLGAVHPDDEVIRAEVPTQFIERELHKYGPLRANFPRLHRELYVKLGRLDRYTPWLPALLGGAVRAHRRRPFDLALATGNPWTSFAVVAALHATTGVPYVMDYRDSWTLNQFTQEPAFPPGHQAYAWERRLVRHSAAVLFVNEPMLSWHARRYPEVASRMMVLENGYDPDFVTLGGYRPPEPRQPLRSAPSPTGTTTTSSGRAGRWPCASRS